MTPHHSANMLTPNEPIVFSSNPKKLESIPLRVFAVVFLKELEQLLEVDTSWH